MNEKEARLAAWCRERKVDGILFRRRTNIAWLTDGADVHVDSTSSTGVASLLWTPRKKTVFTTNIESRRMADEEFGDEWDVRENRWWEPQKIPKGKYASDFPDDPLADLRASLTSLERRRIREVGKIVAAEVGRVMRVVRRGWTEHRVAGELSGRLRKEGLTSAVLLVASDARIAKYRHPIPTDKKIDRTFMLAACPRKWGLTVAITRLGHFGRKLPPSLRQKHDAVCLVDAALHAATLPGVRWCDILAEGIKMYRETGFPGEWKRHHQGGPMGYEGRDFKATPAETRRVAEHQVVGWNPSITGTKSEDTILSSGELLTPTPNWPRCGTRPDILLR